MFRAVPPFDYVLMMDPWRESKSMPRLFVRNGNYSFMDLPANLFRLSVGNWLGNRVLGLSHEMTKSTTRDFGLRLIGESLQEDDLSSL